MSVWQAITAPFTRFFSRLRSVSEQTYCGDSPNCEGLTYEKGNLNQETPARAAPPDIPPPSEDQGRKPENYPAQ